MTHLFDEKEFEKKFTFVGRTGRDFTLYASVSGAKDFIDSAIKKSNAEEVNRVLDRVGDCISDCDETGKPTEFIRVILELRKEYKNGGKR